MEFIFGNKKLKFKVEPLKQGLTLSPQEYLSQRERMSGEFDKLVSTLRTALLSGFDVSYNVLKPSLESFIDLSLLLSEIFKEGAWRETKLNPDLKFLDQGEYGPVSRSNIYEQDGESTDEIGNPKQKIDYFPGTFIQSEHLAFWFKDLASIAISIMRESVDIKKLDEQLEPLKEMVEKTKRSRAVSSFHSRSRKAKKKLRVLRARDDSSVILGPKMKWKD